MKHLGGGDHQFVSSVFQHRCKNLQKYKNNLELWNF